MKEKVRFEHPGKKQIAYVLNNVPLEAGTHEMMCLTFGLTSYKIAPVILGDDKKISKKYKRNPVLGKIAI